MKIKRRIFKAIFIIYSLSFAAAFLIIPIAMPANALAAETDLKNEEKMLVCLKISEENRIEYETLFINFGEKNFECIPKKNSILIRGPKNTGESEFFNLVPFELKCEYDADRHIPELKIESFYLSRGEKLSGAPALDAISFAPLNNYSEKSVINFADERFISFEKKASGSEGGTWHPSYEKRCVAKPDLFEKESPATYHPLDNEIGDERSTGSISMTDIFGDKIKKDLAGAKKVKYPEKLKPHNEAANETDEYCWNIKREFGRFEAFIDVRFNFSNLSSWSIRYKPFKNIKNGADDLFKKINLEKSLSRLIKKALPDAVDAFLSPSGRYAAVIVKNDLRIFKNDNIFRKPLFKHEIKKSGDKGRIEIISIQFL